MSFTNLEISISSLPSLENLTYNQLAPAYARISATVTFAADTVLMFAFLVWSWRVSLDVAVFVVLFSLVLLLMVLMTLFSWFAARAKKYAVREHDMVFESGVFWRSQTIQPLNRVQHVEVTAGPIDKRAGLANVVLFSAGSGTATFTIPGLPVATAEELREFALRYQDAT